MGGLVACLIDVEGKRVGMQHQVLAQRYEFPCRPSRITTPNEDALLSASLPLLAASSWAG
jgi:hypothetical protein